MTTLKLALDLIKRYAGFVAFALGVLFAYILMKKPKTEPVRATVERELASVRAEHDAERKIAALGVERARQAIEADYAHVKQKLSANEARAVEILSSDPVALARFLVRVDRRR